MASLGKKVIMKNLLNQMIESFDVFGQMPQLRISNKNKYTSKIGFCFTMILITTVIIYMAYSIRDLAQQSDPSVISSQYQLTDSSPFPLQRNNYTFTMSIVDQQLKHTIILNKHVVIRAKQCHRHRYISDTTGEVTTDQACDEYPLESCTMDHFITEVQIAHFSKSPLGTQQCFQMERWDKDPPVVQSYVQGMEFKYLQITLEVCQNTTESSNCAPKEEIDEKLATGYYVIHQSDYLLNLDDPKTPFEEIISLQTTTFSISSSKTFYSQVQLQTAKTDVGTIAKEYEEESRLPLYLLREAQESYNSKYILQHILQFDNKATIHKRNYIKLQTIIGSAGGLYSVLFLGLQFLLRYILQIKMNVEMANRLFNFECENQKSNQQKLVQQSMGMDIKDNIELKKFLKRKKKSLVLNIKTIVSAILNIKNPVIQQLEYAQKKYQSKLDVLNLVTKIHEIDKLKYILLTEEQQNLFNYLPKPTIPYKFIYDKSNQIIDVELSSLEQQKAYKMILSEEKTEFQKLQQAFSAYQNIQQKQSQDRIEKQLISYLDQEVIDLFDELLIDDIKLEKVFPNLNSQIISIRNSFNRPQSEDYVIELELRNSEKQISVPRMQRN